MPNPRAPLARLEATGTLAKNPNRYRDRLNEPTSPPLGKPTVGLTKKEVEAWQAITRRAYWLCEADRFLVEYAAKLRAKMLTKRGLDLKEGRFFMSVLRTLGMTPIDRSRITTNDGNSKPASPAAEFIN